MKRILVLVACCMMWLVGSQPVWAQEFGSKEEAIALVKKAVAYAKDVGIEKAAPEFTDPKGKWVDRDLYLTVVDKNGIRLAHGQNAKLVGKNFGETVDVTGVPYGKQVMDRAVSEGSGWVSYTFADPVTKKQLPKESYFEKSGELIFVMGVYKR